MRKSKIWALLILAICLTTLTAACSSSGNSGKSADKEKKPTQAAMIISIAKGDPFLDLAYSGLEQLGKDKGIETKIIEAIDKSEHEEQIRAMAELGANPIYVFWDDLGAAVLEVAPDFPDTKFIIGDAYVTSDLDNVKTIVVEPQEASFIAGFVAAKTTQNKKVGFVGSMDTPVINRFKVGFEAGVQYGDPAVQIEAVYAGNPNDPVKGQEIAKLLAGNGADIIMHAANKTGLGVIKGAEEAGVKAIGVDEWQGSVSEAVIWSALKDIAGAVYKAGESALDGTFEPGLQTYDIGTGIQMYDERDFNKLSSELQAEVEQLVQDMKDGKIVVPTPVQ